MSEACLSPTNDSLMTWLKRSLLGGLIYLNLFRLKVKKSLILMTGEWIWEPTGKRHGFLGSRRGGCWS